MATNAKERICDAALKLFNKRGYAEVSLRDIAREADIAIGGLTYHFAKKEDLLAYMLADLHGGFEAQLNAAETCGSARAESMLDLFCAARNNQERYPFYFRHINSILAESAALREDNAAFAHTLVEYYTSTLTELESCGFINPLPQSAAARLACEMVALHGCWSTTSSPVASGAAPAFSVDTALASLVSCLVSPNHAPEFSAMCKARGIVL